MRNLFLLLAGVTLVGCSTAPAPPDPRAEAELRQLLAGKVAGAPTNCIPYFRSTDMRIIDDNRIIFRDTANRVWLNTIPGGCPGIAFGNRALLFRNLVTSNLCQGEIAQVIDPAGGFAMGSCVLGPFVPYTTP